MKNKANQAILCAFLMIFFLVLPGCNNQFSVSDDVAGTESGSDSVGTESSHESAETESRKEIDIYLLGGQSNASGATEHKDALDGVFKNVGYTGMTNKSWKTGGNSSDYLSSFERFKWAVTAGLGELPTRMGPEYGMAEVLNEQYEGDKKALIFKSAAGATTLVAYCTVDFGTWLSRSMWDEGYDPSETTDGIGYQYYTFVENFTTVYNTLVKNGYSPKIKGMAWYQGGSDLAAYRQYKKAIIALINDLRFDLFKITDDEDVKQMPFVIGKIAPTFSVYNNPLVPKFNEMLQEVADITDNCETIDTSDLIINNPDGSINGSDQFHFNYNDSRILGNRLADKILEMNN